MKKKRILLGLTLAGAAFLALASCSKDEDNKKEDTSTSEVVSSSEAKSSSSEAKSSSSSEAKSSSSEATEKVTVKFGAKFLDGTQAKYFDDLQVTVDKGGKVSKPETDPSVTGYEFLGYYTSATLSTKVDFDTVTYTTNKTIYCAFDKLTDYHTKLAAAADGQYAIAEDFNAGTALTKGGFGATAAITDASSGDVAGVTMNAFAADVNGDGQADGQGERGKLDIGFGGVQSTSVVKGYFEFNLLSFKKDIFIGFIGAKKTATDKIAVGDDYKVINLGTNSAGSGARYKYNNEAKEVTLPGLEFEASKTYRFEYEIDTVAKKIKMYVDGTQVELSNASDKSFDYSAIDVTGIKGVQVTSLGSAVGISVNNVLVEIAEADATEAKANAINAIKAYASHAKYAYAKDAIDAIIAKYTDETTGSLVAATTITQVAELSTTASEEFNAAIANKEITVHYMSAANTAMQKDGADYTATFTNFELGYTVLKGDVTPAGYTSGDLFTDAALTNALPTLDDSITDIYLTIAVADTVTLNYTAKKYVEGDTWVTLANSGTDASAPTYEASDKFFKTQADGVSGDVTYDCIQITTPEIKIDGASQNPKVYNASTVLRSETITDATQSVTINMEGWTSGGNARLQYVTATAYNAAGEAIGTKNFYTSANKTKGAFSEDAAGNVTDMVLSASENISYVEFTINTSAKSYFVTSVKITYAKA